MAHRVAELNRREARSGVVSSSASWHNDFRDTCWVFVGGLSKELSEGDVICVLSQYGEIEDIHLVRDHVTGQSKGFGFCKYEDWRSTVLCVDNFNGAKLLGNTLKVSHTRYERPRKKKDLEENQSVEELLASQKPGHAYRDPEKIQVEGAYDISNGFDVFEEQRKLVQAGKPSNGFLKNPKIEESLKQRLLGNDSSSDSSLPSIKRKSKKSKKSSKEESRGKKKAKMDTTVTSPSSVPLSVRSPSSEAPPSDPPRPPESDADRRKRLAALSSLPAARWDE